MKRNDDANAFDEPDRRSGPFRALLRSGYSPHSQAKSTCI